MGNAQITENTETSSALNHFSKRFIISPHPLDTQQSLMFYMHQKLSNNKYILRILSTNDNQEKQRIEDLICKKLAMTKNNDKNHINVIAIDHYIFEEDKGYCNSNNKCYLLFNPNKSQSLTHYLARGYYNRNLQNTFTQEVIFKGLVNLIEGVALLKYYNQPHRHINCDTVYFYKQNSQFLLADPWISPLTDLHQQYHAPEKLKQMRNQIQRHDPYIADLFSIGMVGLKMLGYNNLTQYYSIHKSIDQPGLIQLANNIKNTKLRVLLLKLLSDKIEIREDVLNQTQLNSKSKAKGQVNQNMTKTRQLSGKVASIRKSFVNDSRALAGSKFNAENKLINQALNKFRTNSTSNLIELNNPFSKNKASNTKRWQHSSNNTIVFNHTISQPPQIYNRNVTDKPELDVGSPFTHSSQNIKFVRHPESPSINFTIPNTIPSNLPYQTVKFSNTPTTTYNNTYNTTGSSPYLQSQNSNYGQNIKIINNTSYSSLFNSNSDKLLKNVSSTPVQYHNIPVLGGFGKQILGITSSQKSLQMQGNQNSNKPINKSEIFITQKAPIIIKSTEQRKQQNLSFSLLKKQVKFQQISPMTNVSISPANTIKQNYKIQKEDMFNPLRTKPSYPSQESFEIDHIQKNKIYENLRNLQNKISQAINSSRFNMTENSRISNNNSAHNLQNSGKLIESVIITKEQDSSSQSTIKIINQKSKSQDPPQIIKQNIQQQKKLSKQGISNIQPIQRDDRISPILVRESEHSPLHDVSQRLSEQDQSGLINQESVDFLNINLSKSDSSEKQKQKQNKQNQQKIQEEQKFQDISTTPAKGSNFARLQVNNLTIPQQSDEQSIEGDRPRFKGQYVQQVYQNGGKYVGYMLNGQRNGNGIFYYKDGGYYDGRWKQNMMNGYGKLYYETGKLAYEGQWYQDQFHGRGTVYNDQPQPVPEQVFDYKNMNQSQNYWQYYEGDLSHDMKARYGKLMLSNEQYYQGQFKNDQVHGKGQFHRQDGSVIKGLWSQGILIRQF